MSLTYGKERVVIGKDELPKVHAFVWVIYSVFHVNTYALFILDYIIYVNSAAGNIENVWLKHAYPL